MSLELFHEVPAGAIETLFNEQNQLLFKRADLGKYLGIDDIRHNFRDFPSHYNHLRSDIEGGGLAPTLGRTKNPHDIFINLDGSIEMAVLSKKLKAVALVKWLSKKGVEKIQEEHQQAITDHDNQIQALESRNEKNKHKILKLNEDHQQSIEEKDATITLLNDDLKNREHDNVALQAQRDVYKEQLQKCQDIITRPKKRHIPHAKDPGKDNIVMIIEKNTTPEEDEFYGYSYYVARIQRRFINIKRWFKAQYPNHSPVMEELDNANGVHSFNRFEEEGFVEHFQCYFRLVHIPRNAFYALATSATQE